jgi:transposase
MAPNRHRHARVAAVEDTTGRPSVMQIATIGVDFAKHVFQVHGVDLDGNIVLRRQLRRAHVLGFFAKLPPCLVGMERLRDGGAMGDRLGYAWV